MKSNTEPKLTYLTILRLAKLWKNKAIFLVGFFKWIIKNKIIMFRCNMLVKEKIKHF